MFSTLTVGSSSTYVCELCFTLMEQALSGRAVVAAVRYGTYKDSDLFWETIGQQHIRWMRVEAVWLSKRRFHLRSTLDEFLDVLRDDPTRFVLRLHVDDSIWVRAI